MIMSEDINKKTNPKYHIMEHKTDESVFKLQGFQIARNNATQINGSLIKTSTHVPTPTTAASVCIAFPFLFLANLNPQRGGL